LFSIRTSSFGKKNKNIKGMEGMTLEKYLALSKEEQFTLAKRNSDMMQKHMVIGRVTKVREARKRVNVIVRKSPDSAPFPKEEGICFVCGENEEGRMHTCHHCEARFCHVCLGTVSSVNPIDNEKQIPVPYCESCIDEQSDTEFETPGQYFTMEMPRYSLGW